MIHELPEVLNLDRLPVVKADDAEACSGLPKVAPAPGKHARPHGGLRWEERQQVVEHMVGECADAVGGAHRRRILVLATRRHPVQQTVGVVGAA